MGQTCKQIEKKSEPTPTTYQVSGLDKFPNLTFTFTSDRINRLSCDTVLLFADDKLLINRNYFVQKCGEKQATKIQYYFNVQKEKPPLKCGYCLIIDVSSGSFTFSKICVICIEVFTGRTFHYKNNPLQLYTENALRMIKQSGSKSVMIVYFNEQYGLPKQVSCNIILDAIFNYQKGLYEIGFVCMSVGAMTNVKKFVEGYDPNRNDDKTYRTKSKASKASSYY